MIFVPYSATNFQLKYFSFSRNARSECPTRLSFYLSKPQIYRTIVQWLTFICRLICMSQLAASLLRTLAYPDWGLGTWLITQSQKKKKLFYRNWKSCKNEWPVIWREIMECFILSWKMSFIYSSHLEKSLT